MMSPHGVANRIARALLLLAIIAGLGALNVAHQAISEKESLAGLVSTHGLRIIRGALVAAGLALLGALWLSLQAVRHPQRSAPDPTTALRLFFEILVLAWIGYLLHLQPFRKASFDLTLGLACGLWGLLLLILWATHRRTPPTALRAADVILFNLCLFAVLAEGGLRLVADYSASPVLTQTDQRSIRLIEKRKRQYRPGQLRLGFPLNSGGHNDEPFDRPRTGDPRVALVGDSFSFGPVPHHFHFSTVAERRSGLKINNFGLPGVGPAEYLHLLRHEILPSEPDLIMVNLFVGNDLGDSRRFRSEDRALRLWWSSDNLMLYQVPRRLKRVQEQRLAERAKLPDDGARPKASGRRLETVEEMVSAYPWLEDPSKEHPHIHLERFLDIEHRRANETCDPARTDTSELFAVLREMRRLAAGSSFAVQLIPDEFQLNDALWQEVQQRAGEIELVRDLPQQLIGEWLAREEIPYLDLLPVLRAQCDSHRWDGRHCYHLQDTHFNARGNRVAGEAIARFLSDLLER